MRRAAAAAVILLCTSCATLVNGRYQQVSVDSFPSRAAIDVDCGDAPHDGGVTPATVRLPRRAALCQLTLKKDGYADRVVVFDRQLSRAVQANRVAGTPLAVVGGLFGLVLADELGGADELAGMGWEAGLILGAVPGNQYDKHTGGAYKWVPGDIFITLRRPELQQ